MTFVRSALAASLALGVAVAQAQVPAKIKL